MSHTWTADKNTFHCQNPFYSYIHTLKNYPQEKQMQQFLYSLPQSDDFKVLDAEKNCYANTSKSIDIYPTKQIHERWTEISKSVGNFERC